MEAQIVPETRENSKHSMGERSLKQKEASRSTRALDCRQQTSRSNALGCQNARSATVVLGEFFKKKPRRKMVFLAGEGV